MNKYEISEIFNKISLIEGKHVLSFIAELPSYSDFNLLPKDNSQNHLIVEEIHSNDNNNNGDDDDKINNGNNKYNDTSRDSDSKRLKNYLVMMRKNHQRVNSSCIINFAVSSHRYLFSNDVSREEDLIEDALTTNGDTLSILIYPSIDNNCKPIERYRLIPIYIADLLQIIETINLDIENVKMVLSSPTSDHEQFSINENIKYSCNFRELILCYLFDRMIGNQLENNQPIIIDNNNNNINNNNNNNNIRIENYKNTITELKIIQKTNLFISSYQNLDHICLDLLRGLKFRVNRLLEQITSQLSENVIARLKEKTNLILDHNSKRYSFD